jgi:2-succinyl-5-enolpyruvyl-6-hydroxy-3-cyclohexene-1-carboxylate synthase
MAAAALPKIRKHVILDERSAAFVALGIGKATNHPAALICTSGTAVANYYPAVIEARKSGVPMLLLTADRPAHLHNSGANQTINQRKILGEYPIFFHDLGESFTKETDINHLKKLAGQAFQNSQNRHGPAHLNFPFRKPLEPTKEFVETITDKNKNLPDEPPAKFPADTIKSFRFDDDLLYDVQTTEQPLIIVGQLAPGTPLKHIFWLAEWLEAPVLTEQGITEPDYAIQGFEGFLRNEQNQAQLEPDLILRFGRQPASKSLLKAISRWQPKRHIHFSDIEQISDIAHTTTDFINWNGKYFNTHKFTEKSRPWLQKWKEVEKNYVDKSATTIADYSSLIDGHIYHHIVPTIPDDWSVFISNSFPARDQSLFGQWGTQPVYTNRGASGIDGITSTAMGLNIASKKPAILFTGDLAFLHDTNALLSSALLHHPLVVVVINNQGGSIFRMLPIADHKEHFGKYFETPQQADIISLVKSYGISTRYIDAIDEMKNFDLQEHLSQSESMLSVVECKTDADASMQLRNQLWNFQI